MKRLALALAAASTIALAAQPGGPGGRGPLPSHYTNRSTPLGPVDASAAQRACTGKGHARLVCLADLLKKDLKPELLARLQLPYSVQDARKWSNFPPTVYRDRVGPTLGEFTPAQLGVVKALLKEASGTAPDEGFDELEQILNADDFLKDINPNGAFASGHFHVALLGTPAPKGTWQLYFAGHHLTFSNTYVDGVLAGATPSFRGIEPFTQFEKNGRSNAPLAQEHAAFAAMLGALTAAQLAEARLPQTYTDIIVGPQQDNAFPSLRAGVKAASLNDAQRTLAMRAIETFVTDIDPPDAATILARYRRELGETFIAFSGTTALGTDNDYVRIDGPSVWIEFSMQPGRVLPGTHPHSVWRDRAADYGGNR